MKKPERIPSYRMIWGKIRYFQILHQMSDIQLAAFLNVGVRTLSDYDKNAKNITLDKVENFLAANNLQLTDLISL